MRKLTDHDKLRVAEARELTAFYDADTLETVEGVLSGLHDAAEEIFGDNQVKGYKSLYRRAMSRSLGIVRLAILESIASSEGETLPAEIH